MTFYYALLLVFGAAVALLGIVAFLIRTDKKEIQRNMMNGSRRFGARPVNGLLWSEWLILR